MHSVKGLSLAFLWGVLFESLVAATPGFYIVPVVLSAVIFAALPFTRVVLAIIALIASFATMMIWAFAKIGLVMPSSVFILHIVVFTIILVAVFYAAFEEQ